MYWFVGLIIILMCNDLIWNDLMHPGIQASVLLGRTISLTRIIYKVLIVILHICLKLLLIILKNFDFNGKKPCETVMKKYIIINV